MTPLSTNQSKLTIVVRSGSHSGQSFVVPFGGTLSFGRTNVADVAFEDDHFMSGKHFEIQNYGDHAEVRDFNSTNKTWVNNVAIHSAKLLPDDTFRAGKTVFSLEWEPQESHREAEPAIGPAPAEVPGMSGENDYRSPISSVSGFPIAHTKPIPDASQHILDPEEVRRNSSPIESIDETYDEPEDSGNRPLSSPNHSPMNFESFGSPLIEEGNSGDSAPQTGLLVRLKSPSTAGIWSLISKVSQLHATKVVVHFKKISALIPNGLEVEPVFKEISDSQNYMPVIVDGKEWLRRDLVTITERLAMADGLMMMVGENPSSLLDQLQVLSQRGVPGFSEEGGFLGWCWPSQWHAIGQHLNEMELRALMGTSIHGVIYPWSGTNLAQVIPELSHEMRDLGFV